MSDVDGFVSYMDRNEPVRLSAALGTGDLELDGADVRRRRQRRRRGGDARRRGGQRRLRRVRRRLPRPRPGPVLAATARPGGCAARPGQFAYTAPYGMLTPAQTTAMQTMRFMHEHGVSPGRAGRGRPGVLRPRPAQPAGDPLRHAADPRGVPRLALDRRAVPPLRLLPGERRRGGDRRHDGRAGPRPAPSRRWPSSPPPTGSSTATASARSTTPTSRPPTTATSGGMLWQRAGRDAGRRPRRPVLRELHRAGADGDRRDGLLRAGGARRLRRRRRHPVATGGCRSTPPAATSARPTSTASATSSRRCARSAASRRARSTGAELSLSVSGPNYAPGSAVLFGKV